MKKFLIGLGVFILLAFGGLNLAYKLVMGGEEYYVQITTDGEKINEKDDSGNDMITYDYSLPGYDKEGKEKTMDFTAYKDRPLKREAYLKIIWNEKKGVTSYEEVSQNDIPKAAQEKLANK